jgi:hypothetical protein
MSPADALVAQPDVAGDIPAQNERRKKIPPLQGAPGIRPARHDVARPERVVAGSQPFAHVGAGRIGINQAVRLPPPFRDYSLWRDIEAPRQKYDKRKTENGEYAECAEQCYGQTEGGKEIGNDPGQQQHRNQISADGARHPVANDYEQKVD